MWAFVLFYNSLVSPKATPLRSSCAVKLSSSLHWWRVEMKLNCTAADGQLGDDLHLSKILFSETVQTKDPQHYQWDECFLPLAVFYFLLWCHLFFLSLVCYVHISFSFLHLCLITALFLSFDLLFSPSSQCSFAPRIQLSWRGHRVHTVNI